MSRNTVIKAEREVATGIEPSDRQRALGGGDIKAEDKQPGLLEALDELVHPETRGNPMSYLRWTSKSTGKLADELVRQGFKITDDTVGRMLRILGYSLQAPSKQKEGTAHPDRDAQFGYLNKRGGRLREGGPAGDQRRHQEEGARWRVLQRRRRIAPDRRARRGPRPMTSSTKSWAEPSPTASTTWPTTRAGCRSATSPTRPRFAVEAIRRWWDAMGNARVPAAPPSS